jgi:hypothetical protein
MSKVQGKIIHNTSCEKVNTMVVKRFRTYVFPLLKMLRARMYKSTWCGLGDRMPRFRTNKYSDEERIGQRSLLHLCSLLRFKTVLTVNARNVGGWVSLE